MNTFTQTSCRDLFMASMFNNAHLHCGNYDGDDDADGNCKDYDYDEDLHMMFDDEDYAEQYES